MEHKGIMICGHGSRNKFAMQEFAGIVARLQKKYKVPLQHGYLEFANPVIAAGLDKLRTEGVKNCLAVPGMLFAAGHAKDDIPCVLNEYEKKHPEMKITYGRELGLDTRMIRASAVRVQQAIDKSEKKIALGDTLLMVVGRGTSDPDANSNINKIMRMLWEGFGFGWAEVCYSGVTFPLVPAGLRHAAKLGYKRIIVFPYFLFTGVLVKRIYSQTAEVANENKNIEFLTANYLGEHELVVETFIERINEIEHGANLMNCQMCKYREQVLGFESQVGMAQHSHHHHVEGIGGGLENCPCKGDCDASCRDEEFCKKHNLPFTPVHSHDHHHHHPAYPRADHPHGPKSIAPKGKSNV